MIYCCICKSLQADATLFIRLYHHHFTAMTLAAGNYSIAVLLDGSPVAGTPRASPLIRRLQPPQVVSVAVRAFPQPRC